MVRPSPIDARARTIVGSVGVILLAWLLLVPPGGHADEPSHVVQAAATVRSAEGTTGYVLPDRYRVAEPGCYAFQPTQPATCSTWPEILGEDTELTSRASDYPPGGHLVLGVAELLPGPRPLWWARLAAVAASAALVAAGLVAALARSRLTAAALLLGLTPMAWSIMAAANPSAFATAGAVALWVGVPGVLAGARARAGRDGWLVVAGWSALVLVRRDGLVWASLIVSIMTLAAGSSPLALARRIGRTGLAVAGAGTTVTLAWGLTSSSSASRLVVLAPLTLVVAEVVARRWPTLGRDGRAVAATTATVVGAAGWVALVSTRPGGWNTNLALTVIGQTDDNLVEAIGVLGWLDTSVPAVVVFGWLVVVGVLVAGAIRDAAWWPAVVLVAVAAVSSWTLELVQGNDSGTYWQGRYSLPLLIGVPLLLVHRRGTGGSADRDDHLVAPVAVAALIFVNVAAWAAARRYGVGTVGSHLPWKWDTPLQPVPPVILLAVMAVASAVLARAVVVGPARHPERHSDRSG